MPSKDYEHPSSKIKDLPQENKENVVEAEITLTDKLNKNLLESFLSRINASDKAFEKFVTTNGNNNIPEEEWCS